MKREPNGEKVSVRISSEVYKMLKGQRDKTESIGKTIDRMVRQKIPKIDEDKVTLEVLRLMDALEFKVPKEVKEDALAAIVGVFTGNYYNSQRKLNILMQRKMHIERPKEVAKGPLALVIKSETSPVYEEANMDEDITDEEEIEMIKLLEEE